MSSPRKVLVGTFLLAALVLPGFAQAVNCLDYGSYLHWMVEMETPGSVMGVAIAGDYAFLSDGMSGLQVVDISDPDSPVIVGSADTPGFALNVAVDGDFAFVADGAMGLQVIDISAPEFPVIVGSLDTPGSATAVAVDGGFAHVADGSAGLLVVDVSVPESPVVAGSVSAPGFSAEITLSGNHCFLACGVEGLNVIDILDPGNPVIVGSVDTPGSSSGVAVLGNWAYVADGASGLQVVDVSIPESPVIAGSLGLDGASLGIEVLGGFAYMSQQGVGLQVVDISMPESPVPAGSVELVGMSKTITVSGSNAYVVAFGFDLQVIDISGAESAPILSTLGFSQSVKGVASKGDYAYSMGISEFSVIDMASPATPVAVGSIHLSGYGQTIAMMGNYAFVSLGVHAPIQVVDVSVPESPVVVSNVQAGSSDISIDGNIAVVGGGRDGGFSVVDITDPTSPVITGRLPIAAYSVFVQGEYAYFGGNETGMWVVDLSNVHSPTVVGWMATETVVQDIVVIGNFAYLAEYEYGLRVVDVSVPESPVIVGSRAVHGYAMAIGGAGDHIYVSDWIGPDTEEGLKTFEFKSYLQVFDVSDSTNPVVTGRLETPGLINNVDASGNYLLVADNDPGMTVGWKSCSQEAEISVAIDIKPGSDSNTINCKNDHGVIPVAILTTDDFDAMTVDHTTVRFGVGEASEIHTRKYRTAQRKDRLEVHGDSRVMKRHEEDVDGDGDLDLVFHFAQGDVGIQCGDTEVTLVGETYDGQSITGTDAIRTVPNGGQDQVVENLVQVTPNPFNPATSINFRTDGAQRVRVAVYDLHGRLVTTLTDQQYLAGEHSVKWHGRDSVAWAAPSGLYIFLVDVGGQVQTRKAMLLR